MNTNKKYLQTIVKVLAFAALLFAAWFLLGPDFSTFFIWWAVIAVLGYTFMPLTSIFFQKYEDRGWMFSKVIALAVCGYVVWLFCVLKILPFTTLTCMAVTVVCMAVNLWMGLWMRRQGMEVMPDGHENLVYKEELIFFILFLLWTYMAGFHPAAYGTEKFMDFGFMQSMMKSTTLPAIDMWYAQEPMNYYYGGQYLAVFFTKLTTTSVEITYNLMRTFVAAFAFVLPFVLVRQMLCDRMKGEERKHGEVIATLGGLLAGGAVSLSGNMHYVIYGKILPVIQKLSGTQTEESRYWFPNATRYIGHDPETLDRTIHEFPAYSFVLGDLHAHVINVFLVLTVVGILYGWLRKNERESWKQPAVVLCGLFLGIFQFSNTWDFAIYYVVICGTLFFGNLKRYQDKLKEGLKWSVVQWMEVLAVAMLAVLPFNLTFNSSMAQGVALCQNHSAFYQLCVLWALPVLVCVAFLICYFYGMRGQKIPEFLKTTAHADLYTAILSLCAIGLMVLPEIVYVRDIYEKTSARSNTMFKLTYQAYILFGICMAYILTRFVTAHKKKVQQAFGVVMTCVLLSTFGYLGNAAYSWFGNIFDRSGYQTLDATLFLENDFPQDAGAIRWLNANIEGRPVVLEANGDSYSDYERVSAMTGLPTVMGWYVHEWLWRNDTADLNTKAADIETIYTSTDEKEVESLLEQYDISYIFIGSCEWEKYPALNERMLRGMGQVVYEDEGAVIIKID